MNFYLLQNYYIKGHTIIYPLKKKEICYYNPRCFISSGFMFDDIVINMVSNKALECHQEGVDSLFTNIDNKIMYTHRGSLQ